MDSGMTFTSENSLEIKILFKNEKEKDQFAQFLTEVNELWPKYQVTIHKDPKTDVGFSKFIAENL
jgi:hypothetical protein